LKCSILEFLRAAEKVLTAQYFQDPPRSLEFISAKYANLRVKLSTGAMQENQQAQGGRPHIPRRQQHRDINIVFWLFILRPPF